MQEPGVISRYVDEVAAALAFDPPLAQRVRQEVEDHLREAAAAQPMVGTPEAERRAVVSFGDPRTIAAQFIVASLASRARRVGVSAVVMITAAFLAMKARLAWYAVMQWPAVASVDAFGGIVGSIDRQAFWVSVIVGAAGWIHIGSRRIPAALSAEYHGQLRRFQLLGSVATGALVVSIVGDGVLTSLRLAATGWSLGFVIPVLTMAVEVAAGALLIASLRGMARRTASARRTLAGDDRG